MIRRNKNEREEINNTSIQNTNNIKIIKPKHTSKNETATHTGSIKNQKSRTIMIVKTITA